MLGVIKDFGCLTSKPLIDFSSSKEAIVESSLDDHFCITMVIDVAVTDLFPFNENLVDY